VLNSDPDLLTTNSGPVPSGQAFDFEIPGGMAVLEIRNHYIG